MKPKMHNFALLLGQLLVVSAEDWISNSSFSHYTSDYNNITAFITVTFLTKDGWKSEEENAGRYGGGYVGSASGILVHVSSKNDSDDHMGCHMPLYGSSGDRKLPSPGEPWIALIKRGKCNFEQKVQNAFLSNAAGVLVYNDRDSQNLDKMKLSSGSGRNISAVFTYKSKGEELAKRLAENDKVYITITIAGQTSLRATNINRTSVLFVSITFIVLMIISLAWLVFYYVQRFRYIHAKDRLSVSPTELENILLEMPGVADVAVVGIPDALAGEVPKAFIVKQPNNNLSEFVDSIPRNPSGKILRNELRISQ